jgi:hypothetical protein
MTNTNPQPFVLFFFVHSSRFRQTWGAAFK